MRLKIAWCALFSATSLSLAQDPTRPVQDPARPAQDPVRSNEPQRSMQDRKYDFTMARRYQKATDLMGKTVKNSSDENLGKLEDIVVDANSGRILYGVLSFGGFMGMGDKLFAIPWESMEFPDHAKNFVLNVSKDRLKSAEGFDKSNWPNFADETWATKTYKYYEHTPYWQSGDTGRGNSSTTDGNRATNTDNNARNNMNQRDRWYQRATIWQKCSDLCGKDAHNLQNEDIGRISECLIDPDGGRIIYGVLANSGKRFAIPWGALNLSSDAKKFQINVTKEQLKNAPTLEGETWPTVTNERWATDTYRYYHVEPYWIDVTVEKRP